MVKRVTKKEANHLNFLYEKWNKSDQEIDRENISIYYEELGKKYNFDPKTHVITIDGIIIDPVICYRCGGIANSLTGVFKVIDNIDGIDRRYPICMSCYEYRFKRKINNRKKRMK